MVYEDIIKTYGPYKRKDGRLIIILVDANNVKYTKSYPKYVLEKSIGRLLSNDEQVDHIDGNPLNNEISNLQILHIGEHQYLDAYRNEDVSAICTYCGKEFIIKGSTLYGRNRKDRHQSGYFCSRKCCGKYGKEIQNKEREHSVVERIIPHTYQVKSANSGNILVEGC